MAQELKLAPYGEPSFVELRKLSYAYVDKTRFIEMLENCGTRFPVIVRPRCFGKSVFANMLMAYYDKATKDDSDFFRFRSAERRRRRGSAPSR